MAHGSPDYFGQSIYAQYGSFIGNVQTGVVAVKNTSSQLFTASVKGKTVGGLFIADAPVTPHNMAWWLRLDGVTSSYFYWDDLAIVVGVAGNTCPFRCAKNAAGASGWAFYLAEGITFNNLIQIFLLNADVANDLNVPYIEVDYMKVV
jgi:hypothetical protein